MSFEVAFSENNGIHTRYYGDVTDIDLKRAADMRFNDPQFLTIDYLLSDYSEVVNFNVSPEIVKRLAVKARELSETKKDLIVVSIMPKPIQYGLARMFQAYASDDKTGWLTFVANNRIDALAKLDEYLIQKGLKNNPSFG